MSGTAQSHLEVIRFAAANHLCIDSLYKNETRRIEPYSLRRTLDGNIILHAYDTRKDGHRSYRVDRIQGAEATNQTFKPRYAVELSPRGPVAILPTASRASGMAPRISAPRSFGGSSDNSYIFECPYCQKRFYRKRRSSPRKGHKDKQGYRCPGRPTYIGMR